MEAWIYLDRIDFVDATSIGDKVLDELHTPLYLTSSKRVFVGMTPHGLRSTILRSPDVSEAEMREVFARHNIAVAPRCEYDCCDLPTNQSFTFNNKIHHHCETHGNLLFQRVTGRLPK